jgi:hypothetical protein
MYFAQAKHGLLFGGVKTVSVIRNFRITAADGKNQVIKKKFAPCLMATPALLGYNLTRHTLDAMRRSHTHCMLCKRGCRKAHAGLRPLAWRWRCGWYPCAGGTGWGGLCQAGPRVRLAPHQRVCTTDGRRWMAWLPCDGVLPKRCGLIYAQCSAPHSLASACADMGSPCIAPHPPGALGAAQGLGGA